MAFFLPHFLTSHFLRITVYSFSVLVDEKDEAQIKLDKTDISPGDVYQHVKGGQYQVVTLAINESDLEPLVIYKSLKKGTLWARTVENWKERFKKKG